MGTPIYIGALALILYILSLFVFKKRQYLFRIAVSLLFAGMFLFYGAYAPMVIYLLSAISTIVSFGFHSIVSKIGYKRYNFFQGILPSALALVVGCVTAPNVGTGEGDYLVVFLICAILVNITQRVLLCFGKAFRWLPILRTVLWISYYAVAGIPVSILYELFNIIYYIVNLFRYKQRGTTVAPSATPSNNAALSMDGENGDINASAPEEPMLFKGQW